MKTLAGKNFVLATLYQHPSATSIREGLEARGARVYAHEEILHEVRQSLDLPKRLAIESIVLLPAESAKDYQWIAELFHCPIVTELDLFREVTPVNPVIAITGTDGKTSSTEMVFFGLKACGKRAEIFFNFERSPIAYVGDDQTLLVCETWSSQLDGCERFRPEIGVLLNIEPDHLDQHGSMNRYLEAKSRLFHRQAPDDVLIFNAGCPQTTALLVEFPNPRGERLAFTTGRLPTAFPNGYFIRDREIWRRKAGHERALLALPDWPNWGEYFLANRLAAFAVADRLGLDLPVFVKSLAAYRLRPHRQEVIVESEHLRIVNDSKSTNCNSARAAIERFAGGNLIWITGGTDKGLPLSELVALARTHVKQTILLGQFPRFEAELKRQEMNVETAPDLTVALKRALHHASGKTTILFSPIGASDDLFDDYEDRGEQFRQTVRLLG